jgi:putative glutamine amidotransferase
LILSGGGDVDPVTYGVGPTDPLVWGISRHRDRAEHDALNAARAGSLPVLGICRGTEVVNVAMGGTLYLDLERDWSTQLHHRRPDEDLSRTSTQ